MRLFIIEPLVISSELGINSGLRSTFNVLGSKDVQAIAL